MIDKILRLNRMVLWSSFIKNDDFICKLQSVKSKADNIEHCVHVNYVSSRRIFVSVLPLSRVASPIRNINIEQKSSQSSGSLSLLRGYASHYLQREEFRNYFPKRVNTILGGQLTLHCVGGYSQSKLFV